MNPLTQLLWGTLAMACWVAGLFFLRFWRISGDRLFLYFFIGFWIFSAHWFGLGVMSPSMEHRHYFYLARLLAFAFIIFGVIDKNRRHASTDSGTHHGELPAPRKRLPG